MPGKGLLVAAAAAAAALRSADALRTQAAHRSLVEEFRAQCGGGMPPADLVERGLECDPEIPKYDMDEWIAKHGNVAPDHPAVFVNTHTHFTDVFPDMETFIQKHGDEVVTALPEYATSGGALKSPFAEGRVTASFKDLLQSWNDTFVYFSDFKCHNGTLCGDVAAAFGKPELFVAKSIRSRNFLVGGPDSGLPFHKHGMTWQGLSMGRKAWYMLPPGSMSEEMHDTTGPYIFPVRAYHPIMQQKRLGQRPLYCVQHPGEVLFVPEYWWHSTMNLDRYQVAYGEKPMKKIIDKTPEFDRIMELFPVQAYDSAGFSSKHGKGASGEEDPMPYTLMARQALLEKECRADAMDSPAIGVEPAMSRMRNLTGSTLMRCGLAETAAFAHCMLSGWLAQMPNECEDKAAPDALQQLRQDTASRSMRWRRAARELSPTLFRREPKMCGAAELDREA